jgi:squalene-associated FAD-dependent desaturase
VSVIGGGLAGITAALRCADAGYDVTLHEAKPRLGGLTHSFRRRLPVAAPSSSGKHLWVDNGQHVHLRCCTAYLALLQRLGVDDLVTTQTRMDIGVRSSDGRTARIRRGVLPAPLHLAASVMRYPWLTTAERLAFALAAGALRLVDPASADADGTSFGAWLREQRQSERAITCLWDLVGVAALNARADETSLALAATVFQEGVLGAADAGDVGWATVPLQQLHGDAAAHALSQAGVDVRLTSKVTTLAQRSSGWELLTPTGPEQADAVVVATPPAVAERLLPAGALPVPEGWSATLGSSPIVNLHVLLDRPVLNEPFVAGLSEPTSVPGGTEHLWVFDRTTQGGLGATPWQYLAVSLSAADAVVDEPTAVLRQRFLPQLTALLPAMTTASVLDFFVTRERAATFRPSPGTAALRPQPATRLPGLFVAGAWTATGWPATMEGAVRSGEAAAQALLTAPLRSHQAEVVA